MEYTLGALYAKKFRLKGMILDATMNGEPVSKIERLEAELETTESLIDDYNLKMYLEGTEE